MTEVVVTTGARGRARLQPNHHHQHTITQLFSQARCPSHSPTNSVRAPKGESISFHGIAHPKLRCGSSNPVLITKGSWFTSGKGRQASQQPSDTSTVPNSSHKPNLINVLMSSINTPHCLISLHHLLSEKLSTYKNFINDTAMLISSSCVEFQLVSQLVFMALSAQIGYIMP